MDQLAQLYQEKAELEKRMCDVNRRIYTLKRTLYPNIRMKISTILETDTISESLSVGIIRINKRYSHEDEHTEVTSVQFIYDCSLNYSRQGSVDECILCEYKKKRLEDIYVWGPLPMKHLFGVEFQVWSKDMLDVHLLSDGYDNRDFEGGMCQNKIDFQWDDHTFVDGPVTVHEKLGAIHELQYLIYRKWYDQWTRGAFDPKMN